MSENKKPVYCLLFVGLDCVILIRINEEMVRNLISTLIVMLIHS